MPDEKFRYNPMRAPDPVEWLAMEEDERIFLISRYHRRRRPRATSPELHNLTHMIIENQIALNDGPAVKATVERLQSEGLDRHEALHAIGTILAPLLFGMLSDATSMDQFSADYASELSAITAESWRRGDFDEF